MTTSWDEASRCPKCETAGEVVDERKAPTPGKLVTLTCPNKRCRWFGTNFQVKVNPDGTIPDPITKRPKAFQVLPDDKGQTQEILERGLRQSMQPGGGEIVR